MLNIEREDREEHGFEEGWELGELNLEGFHREEETNKDQKEEVII